MFGEDQNFTPMDVASDKGLAEAFRISAHSHDISTHHPEDFDPRHYRPLEVQLDLALFDVQANLVKNCSPEDPPCPFLVKNYRYSGDLKNEHLNNEPVLCLPFKYPVIFCK